MDFVKQLTIWASVSAICFAIELIFAAHPRPARDGKTVWTDLLYWFFTPLASIYVQVGIGVLVLLALFPFLPWHLADMKNLFAPRDTLLARQPLWAQAIEMLIIGDFVAYWAHRACHRGWLWRFHTVHHSSPQVNWLSAYRMHPVNDFFNRTPQVLVFVLLGFDVKDAFIYGPLMTFYGTMEHMNVDWTFGIFKKVLTSPMFHRWHHTTEREGLNKNFAPMLPIYDILFGTYYMPEGKTPKVYGIVGEKLPESFWKQMIYPFHKRRQRYGNQTTV